MEFITTKVLLIIDWALSLLPNSPFLILEQMKIDKDIQTTIGYINWFFDVSAMVTLLTAWCSAILAYYIIQIVLRWFNAIQ